MMRLICLLSDMMIPLVMVYIILYGLSRKTDIYGAFTEGAVDGMKIVLKILPTLLGLMIAVGVLQNSGLLDFLTNLVRPAADMVGFPAEALPLTLMRLVSSSAATGLLLDIFKQYSPDSFIGRFVSVMMCCTETVFYTISVYFTAIKAKKTRYTLVGALLANAVGVVVSLWICRLCWGG